MRIQLAYVIYRVAKFLYFLNCNPCHMLGPCVYMGPYSRHVIAIASSIHSSSNNHLWLSILSLKTLEWIFNFLNLYYSFLDF